MNQWDWVYAWNYKQPDKKVRTRFLHRLDGIKLSNICTSPDTTATYPKKVNLRRYDMVVPEDQRVHVPDSLYNTMQTSTQSKQNSWLFLVLFILAISSLILAMNSREDIQLLQWSQSEVMQKVSGIEIKWDDMANQLMLSIENQYWQEIQTAVDIANDAGYPHRKVVLINPSMSIVRLMDSNHSEISVNIQTKVITTYSPM